jgi:hypothetical protein
MDMYGISNAVMEANSLHGQIGLEASLAQDKYHAALDKFNLALKIKRQMIVKQIMFLTLRI